MPLPFLPRSTMVDPLRIAFGTGLSSGVPLPSLCAQACAISNIYNSAGFRPSKSQQGTELAQQDTWKASKTRMIARNPLLTDRTAPIAMDVDPLTHRFGGRPVPSHRLQWSLHAPPIGTTAFAMVQDEQRMRKRATTAAGRSHSDREQKRSALEAEAAKRGYLMTEMEEMRGTLCQLEARAQRVGAAGPSEEVRRMSRPVTQGSAREKKQGSARTSVTQRSMFNTAGSSVTQGSTLGSSPSRSVGQGSAWMRKWGVTVPMGRPQEDRAVGEVLSAKQQMKEQTGGSSFRSRAQAAVGANKNNKEEKKRERQPMLRSSPSRPPPGWSPHLFHETVSSAAACGGATDKLYGTWKTKNNHVH